MSHQEGELRRIPLLLAVGLLGLAACRPDRRPIDATAALPAPGELLPAFELPPAATGVPVTSAGLRGAPAVVALWSTHCPFQEPAMAAFDSLAREFAPRGVRFVVLADDPPGVVLDSVLAGAPWRAAASQVGVADGGLGRLFDQSRRATADGRYRVEFVLPSFLDIDPSGRVIRRAFGAAGEQFRPVLDSLAGALPVGTLSPAT
jgi:hypothetical protein